MKVSVAICAFQGIRDDFLRYSMRRQPVVSDQHDWLQITGNQQQQHEQLVNAVVDSCPQHDHGGGRMH